MNSNADIIERIGIALLNNDKGRAKDIIEDEYKFTKKEINKRSYTDLQKMQVFIRDGFIDRYSGKRLIIPGILKVFSIYFPNEFPYHPHWKMNKTHISYWELTTTVDHINPIALGGKDDDSNWVTTSMKNNSIKSNYSLEEIGWKLYEKGNINEWDGLTQLFIELVNKNESLLDDNYIKRWYNVAKKAFEK